MEQCSLPAGVGSFILLGNFSQIWTDGIWATIYLLVLNNLEIKAEITQLQKPHIRQMEPQLRDLFAHSSSWRELDTTTLSYRFPIFPAEKQFESFQDIKDAIFAQAYAFDCQGMERMLRYRTGAIAGKTVAEFRCKYCEARLQFVQSNNLAFAISVIENLHFHSYLTVSKSEKRYIGLFTITSEKTAVQKKLPETNNVGVQAEISKEKRIQEQKEEQIGYSLKFQQYLKQEQLDLSIATFSEDEQHTNMENFEAQEAIIQKSIEKGCIDFKGLFQKMGFETKIKRNNSSEIPETIVAISKQMERIYQKYPETICVNSTGYMCEVHPELIYRLTVVSIFAPVKIKIVGYIIHINQEAASIQWGLQQFLFVHKIRPNCFISDFNINILEYFGRSSFRSSLGIKHILDSETFLENIKQIIGAQNFTPKINEGFLVWTRSYSYPRSLTSKPLFNDRNVSVSQETIRRTDKYIQRIKKYVRRSYFPSNFIGFIPGCSVQIKQTFIKQKKANTLQQFVKKLKLFEQRNFEKDYDKQLRKMQQKLLKYDIKEQREMMKIKQQVETKVFIEILMRYFRYAPLLNKQQWNTKLYNQIKMDYCCHYQIHTRLPCIHHIIYARTNNIPYVELVHERWRTKKGGQRQKEQNKHKKSGNHPVSQ